MRPWLTLGAQHGGSNVGEAGETGVRVGRLSPGLVISSILSPSLSHFLLRTWPFIALAEAGKW